MNIGSIIKQENYTAKVNDTIVKVLEAINKYKINGMPVVDESNKLVGMVVKGDIYRFMISPGHYDSCPVEWVMSRTVIFANADEDFLVVTKRLLENDILAMPVVENDKVIGTISMEDLLNYFISKEEQS